MAEPSIESDEWVMLSWFYEIGWDESPLPELGALGAGERDKIPRLQDVLGSLLDRGCIELRQANDRRVDEAPLAVAEARAVVREAASWTLHDEAGFDSGADYFVAVPTAEAKRLYEVERAGGRAYLEFESVAFT